MNPVEREHSPPAQSNPTGAEVVSPPLPEGMADGRSQPGLPVGAATTWELSLQIGMVSAAVLLLQLLQTRLFSVLYWNHLVYFIVTIALLGFGISGTWLAFGVEARIARTLDREGAAMGFALSGLASLLLAPLLLVSQQGLLTGIVPLSLLGLTYLLAILPHFFAGWLLGTWFRDHPTAISRLYFADLVGAGIGCILFVLAIGPLGLIRLAVLTVLAGAVPAWWGIDRGRSLRLGGLLLACVAPVWVCADRLNSLIISESTKSIRRMYAGLQPGDEAVTEVSAWNSTSRVDVLSRRQASDAKNIFIDGDAVQPLELGTPAVLPPLLPEREFMLLKRAPFMFGRRFDSALIIGSGGGLDVVNVLRAGVKRTDAVEINPTICHLVSETYRSAMNDLYFRPGVNLYFDEGRSFLRRSDKKWDLIVLNSIDTFAAMNSGAYVLSENYLYTLEGFADYLDHLTPDGMLVISRWFGMPESLRLFVLALESLYKSGADPNGRILVHLCADPSRPAWGASSGKVTAWVGMVIKRSPFSAAEREAHHLQVARDGGTVLFPAPGASGTAAIFGEYAEIRSREAHHAYFAQLPFDVRPVDDDAPFFFNSERWSALFPALAKLDLGFVVRGEWPSLVLFFLLGLTGLLTALFICIPLWWGAPLGAGARPGAPILYVAALGVSFIFIEISLMQRFSLVLGHPSLSLAVVLATLLVSSGIGSLASGARPGLARGAFPAIAVLCGVAAWIYPALSHALLPLALPWRVLGTVLMTAPLGFFLGMPFPLGLTIIGCTAPTAIPWVWGINGGCSVLGSVLAIIAAMQLGFTAVLLLAAVGYLIAWACFRRFAEN